MNALISIRDGIGPSIFCQKMEMTSPMSEDLDGKGVCFTPESAFPLQLLIFQALLPIWTLTWRINSYVSRQGKGINGRHESTKGHTNYFVDINQ